MKDQSTNTYNSGRNWRDRRRELSRPNNRGYHYWRRPYNGNGYSNNNDYRQNNRNSNSCNGSNQYYQQNESQGNRENNDARNNSGPNPSSNSNLSNNSNMFDNSGNERRVNFQQPSTSRDFLSTSNSSAPGQDSPNRCGGF